MGEGLLLNRARQRARRDTRAYAPSRVVAARPDEQPPVIVPLGTLAGPGRQLVFVAPAPCRITRLGIVSRSDVPPGLGNGWQLVWRRQPADYVGTAFRDIVLGDAPLRFLPLDDPVPIVDDEEGSAGGSGDDPPPDPGTPPTTPLDEATGGLVGAFVGTPSFEVDGPPVDLQLGIALDGTGSQYATVDLPAGAAMADGGAVDVWFRPAGELVSGEQHLIGWAQTTGAPATAMPRVVLRPSKDGQPNGITADVGGVLSARSAQWRGWEPARWNLLSMSWGLADTTDLAIRCNGCEIPVTRTAGATLADEPLTLVIGKTRTDGTGSAYPFAGSVAGVAVYDHPLDLAGHQRRYHALASRSTRVQGGSIVAGRLWTTAGLTLDPSHRLLNTGDAVWLEANPFYAAPVLVEASALVAFEVI